MSVKDNIVFNWLSVADVEKKVGISVSDFGETDVTYEDGRTKHVHFVTGRIIGQEEREPVNVKINNESWKALSRFGKSHLKDLKGLDIEFEKEKCGDWDCLIMSKVM